MSLSGMFNIGHDVGGFAGRPPEPELLIRWTQAGLLHPRFLMNSWKDNGVTTSPWLHPEALPAIRDALRLRLLMPYLYSAMFRAHEAHIPVLAPTFVAFEDDPACFADADAAMFGPSLLAAPAMREGACEVEVYLPRGRESWRDFWTGRVYAAGRSATIPAPLDRLPLLAPAGAIVATTKGSVTQIQCLSRGVQFMHVSPYTRGRRVGHHHRAGAAAVRSGAPGSPAGERRSSIRSSMPMTAKPMIMKPSI